MTEKELIRCALLGNEEAQKQCTEKGIMLPCPWCNCKTSDLKRSQSIEWYWRKCRFCGAESSAQGTKSKANLSWNTRPTLPIGRCVECKNWNGGDCYRQELTKSNDFCSYFKPKEE